MKIVKDNWRFAITIIGLFVILYTNAKGRGELDNIILNNERETKILSMDIRNLSSEIVILNNQLIQLRTYIETKNGLKIR
jgi:hypothetical protein